MSLISNALNSSPYFDDYSPETKDFLRVLFRPGYAVQARELNQLQAILQEQVTRFGNTIYQDGSIIIGGGTTVDVKTPQYIIIDNTFSGAISQFVGNTITGATSGATATVVTASEAGVNDKKTLIVATINGKSFSAGETITTTTGLTATISASVSFTSDDGISVSSPIGNSSTVSIASGIFYTNGLFVINSAQTTYLSKYSNTPSKVAGLTVSVNIVDSVADATLLDNAIGSYNYAAPGANRLELSLTLISKDSSTAPNTNANFIKLVEVRSGLIYNQIDSPQYSDLMNLLASRTYDQSGDFTVTPFNVTLNDLGATGIVQAVISPGNAYVHGYQVKTSSPRILNIPKALTTKTYTSDTSSVIYDNYVTVGATGFKGVPSFNTFESVTLHNGDPIPGATGLIGTAKILNIDPVSSTSWNLHLFDVAMNGTNNFSSVSCIKNTSSTPTEVFYIYGATGPVAALGSSTTITNPMPTSLVFNDGNSVTKTNGSVKFYARDRFTNKSVTTGAVSLTVSNTSNQNFYSTNPTDYICVDHTSGFIVPVTSVTVAGTTATVNVSGSSTAVDVIAPIYVNGATKNTKALNRIPSVTGKVLASATTDISNYLTIQIDPVYSVYSFVTSPASKIKLLSGTGSGSSTYQITSQDTVNNTVTFSVGSSLSVDTTTTYSISPGFSISGGTLTPGTTGMGMMYYATGITGATGLGKVDVTKIVGVISDVTPPTPDTWFDPTKNITNLFNLDNGQRNNYYDYGTISTVGNVAITNPTVVMFEYYSHTLADGFFSADSYADKDHPSFYTDSNGNQINLLNAFDFRATKTGASTFDGPQLLPVSGSTITYDSTYYLSRKDKIVATKDGQFVDVQGIPSESPVPPPDQDNALTLCTLDIPAYTYVADGINVTPNNLNRYTMQDIGRLEQRISNLEYYASLSALEQSTSAYTVTDTSGNSRFKNAILVDSFNGNDSNDTTLNDYAAFIDVPNQELKPSEIKNNYSLYLDSGNSSNYSVWGGSTGATGVFITKDYIGASGVSQPYASTIINLNPFSYFEWVGNCTLDPSTDTWPDTQVQSSFNANTDWNTTQTVETFVPTPGWQPTITQTNITTLDNVGLSLASTIGSGPGVPSPWFSGTLMPGGVSVTDPAWGDYFQNNISTLQAGQSTNVVLNVTDPSTGNITQSIVTYSDVEVPNPEPSGTYVTDPVYSSAPPPPPPPPPVLYVRSRGVNFNITGLMPYTAVHFFFSGTNVDSYITGTTLTTDGFGNISGTFTIPSNKFTTGQNIFLVCDDASGDIAASKTYANAYYIVTGNSDVNTILALPPALATNQNGAFSNQNGVPSSSVNPLAQNFFVDPTVYPEGVVLKGLDLYFSQADDSNIPFTVQIRPTVNGFPSNADILYTQSVAASSVVIGAATPINFNNPVYLKPGQYSIVLITNSSKYLVYAGEIGKTNAGTSDLIVVQPYVGAIYESQNSSTWIADNTKDLKFVLYYCNFNLGTMTLELSDWSAADPANIVTYTSPYVISNSVTFDNGLTTNNQFVLGSYNPFVTGTFINLTGAAGIGATGAWVKNINSNTLSLYSSSAAALNGGATGLYGLTTGSSGSIGAISGKANLVYVDKTYLNRIYPGTLISGTGINNSSYVVNVNPSNNIVMIANSDAGNSGYCVIGATGVTSLVFSRKYEGGMGVDGINIPSEEFNPFSSTTLQTYYKTTDAVTGTIGSYVTINPDSPHEFDNPQVVNTYGESFKKKLVATVASSNVSPIVNLSRQSVTGIGNKINLKISETLSGSVSATTNTVSLSTNGLTVFNGQVITIDAEQMLVTSGGGTSTLTVVRGWNGTTAASHASGSSVIEATEGIIGGATGFNVKSGGNSSVRYITQRIPLTAASSYLTVYFTANKPAGTSIDVYYKIRSSSDSADSLDNKNWYQMSQVNPTAGTFTNDPNNFIEFQFAPNAANLSSDTVPKVVYYNGSNKYTDFIEYRVKIVMYAGTYSGAINTSYIPRVSDLRIIATA